MSDAPPPAPPAAAPPGASPPGASPDLPTPPAEVTELAEACIRFVERAVGVRLDFQLETMPLLDHWLREGREAAEARPDTANLLAHAAGAYFGEVVRRRHASWWRVDSSDPGSWRVELRDVFLSFAPADVARDALGLERGPDGEELDVMSFDLDEDDREAVAARLAELPEVGEEEYRAPSTRLEVLDIVVEAIRQKQAIEEQPPLLLEPEDYGPTFH